VAKIFLFCARHVRVLEVGPSLRWGRGRSLYVGATFVAPSFQHEYIRAVTASKSLWTLCVLCHCTTQEGTDIPLIEIKTCTLFLLVATARCPTIVYVTQVPSLTQAVILYDTTPYILMGRRNLLLPSSASRQPWRCDNKFPWNVAHNLDLMRRENAKPVTFHVLHS
jgi:hypothetical protein